MDAMLPAILAQQEHRLPVRHVIQEDIGPELNVLPALLLVALAQEPAQVNAQRV
jgi:hypothetical protein